MQPASPPTPARPDLVLVGGVPGAGKTTAIAMVATQVPEVFPLDPDAIRRPLRRWLPERVPYRLYRPVVHTAHTLRVAWHLVAGPVPGRRLVVHDPATRPRRRRLFARLARLRGWEPALLLVDVSRRSAEEGQVRRGRVVGSDCFEGHWERWGRLRRQLVSGSGLGEAGDWAEVALVGRAQAAAKLWGWCRPAPAATVHAGERERVAA